MRLDKTKVKIKYKTEHKRNYQMKETIFLLYLAKKSERIRQTEKTKYQHKLYETG